MWQDLLDLVDPEQITTTVITYLPSLVAAVGVFVVFWALSRFTRPPIRKALRRAEFNPALIKLLIDQVYRVAVLGIGVIMAASQLGIDVGAALAGLGVAGIAVGFAAQDSIANTIAGFLIFWDKPFTGGDMVETQGQYGEVQTITLRTTRIRTPNNTYVVIPNRQIIEDVLVNHSMYGETRVQVPVGIAYKEDVARAREVLLDAVSKVEGVADEHEPAVVVKELGDSSVNLEVRVWVKDAADERGVFFRTLEACKTALDEADIEIPFPHLQLFVDDVKESVWKGAAGLRAIEGGAGES
ncbi:MAG: mechanosensitive ion channel family protein [Longimicrobiales bacterium]|nr:mechanosensitive ion channel family protein [Longimicrobiales bacterium]